MTTSYAPEIVPLTGKGVATVRQLLEQCETQQQVIATARAELARKLGADADAYERQRAAGVAEIEDMDSIAADLDVTAARYRARLADAAQAEQAEQAEQQFTGPQTGSLAGPIEAAVARDQRNGVQS